MKIKDGLAKGYEEKKAFEEEQQALKGKHKIEDENVVVVEKSGAYRFIQPC